MTFFDKLPSLQDRPRQACPKGTPTPIAKVERKKAKAQQEKEFRAGVWARDKSRSRASGKRAVMGGDLPKDADLTRIDVLIRPFSA